MRATNTSTSTSGSSRKPDARTQRILAYIKTHHPEIDATGSLGYGTANDAPYYSVTVVDKNGANHSLQIDREAIDGDPPQEPRQ